MFILVSSRDLGNQGIHHWIMYSMKCFEVVNDGYPFPCHRPHYCCQVLIVVQSDCVLIVLGIRKRWFSIIHRGMRCLPSVSDFSAWGTGKVGTGLISFMVS